MWRYYGSPKEAVLFCQTNTAHFRSTCCISQVNKWSKHPTNRLQLLRKKYWLLQSRRKSPYPLISVAIILPNRQTHYRRRRRANITSRHTMGNKISKLTRAPRPPFPPPPPPPPRPPPIIINPPIVIALRSQLQVTPIRVDDTTAPTTIYLTFNNLRYILSVCAACCRGTVIHYCDGTSTYQSWEDVTCNHLSTPLYVLSPKTDIKHKLTSIHRPTTNDINSSLHYHLSGTPAYQMLHGAITEIFYFSLCLFLFQNGK